MSSVQNILNTASNYLGTTDYNNYCEAFVEQSMLGHTGVYPSAASAWQSQQGSGAVQGTNGIQPGDSVYFAPDASNNYYGHTGIYAGNGQFISATYNGVKQEDIGKWMQSTGQKLLGYVPSGQEGRGIVKAATTHGGILNQQMALSGSAPDTQQQQLQTQFAQQKAQAAQQQAVAQQALDQANSYTPSLSSQTQKQQASTPNIQPAPALPAQQSAQYPYADYLTPTAKGQAQMPQTTNQQIGAQPFKSNVVVSPPTDLSKPQINLNSQQPTQGGQ